MDKPKQVIVELGTERLYGGGIPGAACLAPGTYPCRVDGERAILIVPLLLESPSVFVDTEHIYEV